MLQLEINQQLMSQLEQQLDYKNKKDIEFISQGQKFEGIKYKLKNGTFRIIGFGSVNKIPLVLNLGFLKEPKNNADLTDFEKTLYWFSKRLHSRLKAIL